jgi:methyl-accepting chemotaxis protein
MAFLTLEQRNYKRVKNIERLLQQAITQGVTLMAKVDDIRAKLTEVNTATNTLGDNLANIAADIERIKGAVVGGVTEDDADAVLADLENLRVAVQGAADNASQIAASTPEA